MVHSRVKNIYVLTKSKNLFEVIKGLVNISLPEYFVQRIEILTPGCPQKRTQDVLIVDTKKL